MAFWDDLGDSFTGKSSTDIINKQLELQSQALNDKNGTNNTFLIVGVVLVILLILGFITYLILNNKAS